MTYRPATREERQTVWEQLDETGRQLFNDLKVRFDDIKLEVPANHNEENDHARQTRHRTVPPVRP